ncbi:hypothetical protein D9613_006183 [Agrocybe pediades]|uniref:Major facilitator superfamily (MFS) profile domain-containing protein n=1 Tax=Agrocybe pediades TaxID=84607 RepID=A0A8H4VRW2_9AGAR|nr:hypothetical protein D9613_006183 [Agrocybe pediades]
MQTLESPTFYTPTTESFPPILYLTPMLMSMSLAYTMFNVYLPKLLETRSGTDRPQTLEESLWDVVIFTIGGCPGAISWAEVVSGRKYLCDCVFPRCVCVSEGDVGGGRAMWAVLYGWTPEIFGTKVRGTACGIASALSRIGGMIAPMLGGVLLMMDRSIPVYTSVVIFAIAGFCILLLKEGEGDSARGKGKTLVH